MEAEARSKVAIIAFRWFCLDEDCRRRGDIAYNLSLEDVNVAFRSAASAYTTFADRGISLAGIIICSIYLVLLTGLILIGLVWKTLFGRFIWLLLIVGMTAIVVGHLYVWVNSYMIPQFKVDATSDVSATIGYAIGFFARVTVFEIILVLIFFFSTKRVLQIFVVTAGAMAAIGTLCIIIVIFAIPYLSLEINSRLDLLKPAKVRKKFIFALVIDCLKDPYLNYIFVPNLVLNGLCLAASFMLCVLFAHAFLKGVSSTNLVKTALKRAFVLAIVLVCTTCLWFALAVAELPEFQVSSQALFLGVGMLGVEAVLGGCLSLFIVNSWFTSFELSKANNPAKEGLLVKRHEEEEEEENAIPLIYQM